MKAHSMFLSVTILSLTASLSGCWDMGSGEKIGSITRLQRTGFFCKTWEGEIIRGGLNSGSGVMGMAFHFTVEDDALAKKVEQAMDAQQEVKISYRAEVVSLCRSDSDNHFLTAIEPLGSVSVPPTQSKDVPGIMSPRPADITQELLKQNREMIANQLAMIEEMRKQREAAHK